MVEFFKSSKIVKLRSHQDKYLVADSDLKTVRTSRNGSSLKARWSVESLPHGPDSFIRLRSCHGRYLTASDAPFLLGATGKKVTQSSPPSKLDPRVDWEPIRDGHLVKLAAVIDGGRKYLRANGGAPPWKNAVTHDDPISTVTQGWVLWDVESVDEKEAAGGFLSSLSSSEGRDGVFRLEPPREVLSKELSRQLTPSNQRGMDLFRNAKAVRLRSRHDKYLTADEDEESVIQDRNGASKSARWAVEFVFSSTDPSLPAAAVRLKSIYGKYLTASNQPFLLGMTGCKVTQSLPGGGRLDSSVEWVPISERPLVKLRTRYGNFLRANGGIPPWRNSLTHDVPHRTATQDWVLWDVEIVEILQSRSSERDPRDLVLGSEGSSPSSSFSRQESFDWPASLLPKLEGRTIYYKVAEDEDEDDDDWTSASCFSFKGNDLEDLGHKLEEETGLEDIIICSRSQSNGKLYPLRLQLPPNNATMHVIVVPSSSKLGSELLDMERKI